MSRKKSDSTAQLLSEARARLAEPVDVENALAKCGISGNAPSAKKLAASADLYPYRATAFARLAAHLLAMAPGRPRKIQRAVMFYIPDGAYQMQVFALDDGPENSLTVCCEDVLKSALAAEVIAPAGGTSYQVANSKALLTIEPFDGKTENQPPYINAMTGWNRRAIRMILPPTMQSEHVDAALLLCAISAASWRIATAKA